MHCYAQTILQLYLHLQCASYSKSEMELIQKTYEQAMLLFSGRFQPSGKTFIAHVVGTSSILAANTRKPELVAAGLLHNVYEHGDFADGRIAISEARRRRVARVLGTEIEGYLARFAKLRWTPRSILEHCAEAERLSFVDREVVLIRLADHLEHLLDLDVLYYGHAGWRIYVDNGPAVVRLASKLGFPTLAAELEATLAQVTTNTVPGTACWSAHRQQSFLVAPPSGRKRIRARITVNRLSRLTFTFAAQLKSRLLHAKKKAQRLWRSLNLKPLEAKEPAFKALFPPGTRIECVATGFVFTEGPLWFPEEKSLLFSDIPANRIFKLTITNKVETFRYPSGNSNGLTRDSEGRLIACEQSNRRITRTEKDGRITVLAERFEKRKLNSPNDVVVKSDGAIYFTDPPYGITPDLQEQPFQGVYRLSPGAEEIAVVASDFAGPNGLAFSPDEKKLYVDDSKHRHVKVFDVQSDGTLRNGRIFHDMNSNIGGSPDGMKVDVAGNLYCTGPGGVWVFDDHGHHLGTIVPPEKPSNCAWGGDDGRSLYITAESSVYRVRVSLPGVTTP
jgi:gluconolactonase